ncbi:hypothetical protein [Ligilactobacillus sp. LYQ60]|uniref:hypothetical protein n=1 Tax=Ligilactobacillus sp. LYQ60 TaxID=3378799 RepID=UPI003853A694
MINFRYIVYGVIPRIGKFKNERKQILYDCATNTFVESAKNVKGVPMVFMIIVPMLLLPLGIFGEVPCHLHWYWYLVVALITLGIFLLDKVLINYQNEGQDHTEVDKSLIKKSHANFWKANGLIAVMELFSLFLYWLEQELNTCVLNYCNEYFVVYALLSFIDFMTVWVIQFYTKKEK